MDLDDLFDALDRLDADGAGRTEVSSVRLPAALREAARVAVRLGMDGTVNEATVAGLRDRLEVFAQRLALEEHYARHPEARPTLFERTVAAANLIEHPLADAPETLRQAVLAVERIRPYATAEDVLLAAELSLQPTA